MAYITTMLSADIRRAYGHMKVLSETDDLTGVLNMRAFAAMADRLFRQAERYGGDEFVVLLPETPCSAAVGVAERIRKSMEAHPLATRERPIAATLSIGVACYPNHGSDLESVLEKADQAMYTSKADGKNRTTLFST